MASSYRKIINYDSTAFFYLKVKKTIWNLICVYGHTLINTFILVPTIKSFRDSLRYIQK